MGLQPTDLIRGHLKIPGSSPGMTIRGSISTRSDNALVGYRQAQGRDLVGLAAEVIVLGGCGFHALLRRAKADRGVKSHGIVPSRCGHGPIRATIKSPQTDLTLEEIP